MGNQLHPSQEAILRFFKYDHLPNRLQTVSEPFCELASTLTDMALRGDVSPDAELTTALRKLLEAKDCAVRATLGVGA